MLNVAIIGGYDTSDPSLPAVEAQRFARELARQLIRKGHNLLGAAMTALDADVANAVVEELGGSEVLARQRLMSWFCDHDSAGRPAQRSHRFGRHHAAERLNWDPATSVQGFPEPIERAHVVVIIGGYAGTRRAYFWAEHLRKPVIPVAYFGGAGAEIFKVECRLFDERYGRRMKRLEYEELCEVGLGVEQQVEVVITAIERIAFPRKVVTVMSYRDVGVLATHLRAVFQLFQRCCDRFGYVCDSVNHLNVQGRIVPEIREELTQAAFVIADITELKENVMYELGFAEGLDKPVIVTAQQDTPRPFDINDIPILYWKDDDLARLEGELMIKIANIARQQGRQQVG